MPPTLTHVLPAQLVLKTELVTLVLAQSVKAVNFAMKTIFALFPTEVAKTEPPVPTVPTVPNVLAPVLSSEPLALTKISVPVETVVARTEPPVQTVPTVLRVPASVNSLEPLVLKTSILAPPAPRVKTAVLAPTTDPAATLVTAKPTFRETIAKPRQICAHSNLV